MWVTNGESCRFPYWPHHATGIFEITLCMLSCISQGVIFRTVSPSLSARHFPGTVPPYSAGHPPAVGVAEAKLKKLDVSVAYCSQGARQPHKKLSIRGFNFVGLSSTQNPKSLKAQAVEIDIPERERDVLVG